MASCRSACLAPGYQGDHVESASRDGEPPVEEGNTHPHKRARRDPCPGTLPPQGVILFTEPHSELNAGLAVVCASRHQPTLDLAKLDIPVIKDAEAWVAYGRMEPLHCVATGI